MHKRDCPHAIKLATQIGDNIVSVRLEADETLYPITISVKAVDRHHLFIDLVSCITNELKLNIDAIHADATDAIVSFDIAFAVHSYDELQSIMKHIATVKGVEEVKRKTE